MRGDSGNSPKEAPLRSSDHGEYETGEKDLREIDGRRRAVSEGFRKRRTGFKNGVRRR